MVAATLLQAVCVFLEHIIMDNVLVMMALLDQDVIWVNCYDYSKPGKTFSTVNIVIAIKVFFLS